MLQGRVNWIDHAKGICIALIIAAYSAVSYQNVGGNAGWVVAVVAWVKPFLVPTFFFLAALFLNLSVFGPTRQYLDRKILHFAYFYLVWVLLQNILLNADELIHAPIAFVGELGYALIEPKHSLLLVYMLIVFNAVTRLVRFVPPRKVLVIAASVQIAFSTGWIDIGWTVANAFGSWFVFFFAGFIAAPIVFELAERVSEQSRHLWHVLLGWSVMNAAFVALGVAGLPLISLALGFAGIGAIIALALLAQRFPSLSLLGYAGRHCIIIYLTFAIPMTALLVGLKALGLTGVPAIALPMIVGGAFLLPLGFHRAIRTTPLNVVYRRPAKLRLSAPRRGGSASLLPPPSSFPSA